MKKAARFLMTDPAHYAVRYQINPWMRPDVWRAGATPLAERAAEASQALAERLVDLGAEIEWICAEQGVPDLVFTANAGTVLDGKVLLARFRHPERRLEEPIFRAAFEDLAARGVVDEIVELPPGIIQEGAGDAIWDADRGLFWTGWGPRSDREASDAVSAVFSRPTAPLELISERFYHLDTCFRPLARGDILYFPAAFSDAALRAIRGRAQGGRLIEATPEEAAAFCVNAVRLGDDVVMAKAPPGLRRRLEAHGYRVHEIDLAPFILSGGAAFCMTLRLDQTAEEETFHDRSRHAHALA